MRTETIPSGRSGQPCRARSSRPMNEGRESELSLRIAVNTGEAISRSVPGRLGESMVACDVFNTASRLQGGPSTASSSGAETDVADNTRQRRPRCGGAGRGEGQAGVGRALGRCPPRRLRGRKGRRGRDDRRSREIGVLRGIWERVVSERALSSSPTSARPASGSRDSPSSSSTSPMSSVAGSSADARCRIGRAARTDSRRSQAVLPHIRQRSRRCRAREAPRDCCREPRAAEAPVVTEHLAILSAWTPRSRRGPRALPLGSLLHRSCGARTADDARLRRRPLGGNEPPRSRRALRRAPARFAASRPHAGSNRAPGRAAELARRALEFRRSTRPAQRGRGVGLHYAASRRSRTRHTRSGCRSSSRWQAETRPSSSRSPRRSASRRELPPRFRRR